MQKTYLLASTLMRSEHGPFDNISKSNFGLLEYEAWFAQPPAVAFVHCPVI